MRVVIVGAGPAGLMAAEVLASAGHQVAVFDQRRSPARKLVLAGRGGLNLTHSEPLETFLDRYGPERAQLAPAIEAFGPDDLRGWCADLGHETFVGTSGRVFPTDFRAVPLLRSWLARLEESGVAFHLGHRWGGWESDRSFRFRGPTGDVVVDFDAAYLALGGASWPRVGGDGSWQQVLRDRGVAVTDLTSANCGFEVEWSQVMVDRFAGAPLKNVAVVVDDIEVRGDPIVSESGLEGGPIYAHARRVRERVERGEPTIAIDLFPDIARAELVERFAARRRAKQSISRWLDRCGCSAPGTALMREATGNALPTSADQLAELAKAVPVEVSGLAGLDRAISSAGGVRWSEVDDRYRLHGTPEVHVVGEMLDWEAPTGGYLLQACFSTGRWAASALS